uniref:Uncharacterized protein n=1 Tax=Amphora coffeiformis TaxID=265554 RepID=A0A7S3P5N5_9STRA
MTQGITEQQQQQHQATQQKSKRVMAFCRMMLALVVIAAVPTLYRTSEQEKWVAQVKTSKGKGHDDELEEAQSIIFDDTPPQQSRGNKTIGEKAQESKQEFLRNHTDFKYIRAKNDRAGSTISDMLKAHAYCFNHGIQLMGFCGTSYHMNENRNFATALGVDAVLPFRCPKEMNNRNYFVPRAAYHNDEEHTFSPAWLDYMSQVFSPRNLPEYTDGVFRIAAHIRRGDVSLCTDNANRRYLNNMHYIRIIDQVLDRYNISSTGTRTPYEVTIYSESDSHDTKTKAQYEDFAEFTERGYIMRLDYGIRSTWREFIAADVLITAKSGFSMVPAILRLKKPGVIFTPHKHAYMLPHWELVPEIFMQQTAAEMKAMQMERCPFNGTEVTGFNDPLYDYDRHYYAPSIVSPKSPVHS